MYDLVFNYSYNIKMKRKITCLFLFIVMIITLSIQNLGVTAQETVNVSQTKEDAALSTSAVSAIVSKKYSDYNKYHSTEPYAGQEIILNKDNLSSSSEVTFDTIDSKAAIITSETGSVSFTFDVPDNGNFNMNFDYYPLTGRGSQIERIIKIDGDVPFEEAKQIVFSRMFKDSITYDKGFKFDSNGNEIRPQQVETPGWTSVYAKDATGYYTEPFSFYLTKGKHNITLESTKEPLAISQIRLMTAPVPATYKDVRSEYVNKGYIEVDGSDVIIKQAEDAFQKSDSTMYPIFDRSSPATQPNDSNKILLNSIGGSKWKYPGQWISWKINVGVSGLYRIGFRSRQNLVSGQFVNRKLMINGKTPFLQAETLQFNYNGDWQTNTISTNNEECLFYLEKGENIITMETTLGEFSGIIESLENSVYNLNYIYRQILMLTGPNPDPFRDYNLGGELPESMVMLKNESDRLKNLVEKIISLTGEKGVYTSTITRMIVRIDDMLKDTDQIPSKFIDFKNNIVAMGSWLLTAKEQPLELDYLMVLPKQAKVPDANLNIFGNIWFSIQTFFGSFVNNYSMIGESSKEENSIDVWISTGRDQSNIIKQLSDNYFTPDSNISVNIRLVAQNSLLPAVLAKKGPDVYLSSPASDPMNYAMRKAVRKLNDLDGFADTISQFYPSALVPYTYDDVVYALPETQSFPLLFYRKDIMQELGIEKFETWDDIYKIIPELQKKYMDFGIPAFSSSVANALDLSSYWTFLYQNGGVVYNSDSSKIDVDSKIGVESFKKWTGFYTNYRIPSTYDFASRFRIGEIPIAIADYTMYNLLSIFAPEINGLWGFVPVPGTINTDGSIDRSVAGGGVATVMMATTKKVDQSWKFMKWWSSTQAQVSYGQELESLLGTSARYPAANKNAIDKMPWSAKDAKIIKEQWQYVKGIPEVPGGYLKDREINFAFRAVVIYGDDPREALIDHVYNINIEIEKKRKEFGLDK